jgi:hypothetical protein
VDDAALLEIARESGLRQHLHGVDATKAKRLLREFVTALEAALSAQPAERQGEAVAEVCKGAFGIHYIACADPNKLPVGTKLYDHPAAPVGVPKVTLDMMREVEHLCPTEQPHLDKLRWKARRLTELLAAAPSATQGVE